MLRSKGIVPVVAMVAFTSALTLPSVSEYTLVWVVCLGWLLLVFWPILCLDKITFVCKDAVNMDFTIQSTLRRLCTAKISVPYQPSGRSSHPVRTTCHTVRMPNRPSIIRPNDVHFRPNPPLCREGSIQLASVRTFQHYVRTPLGTRPVSDSFQVSIKERSINRPGDVVSRPNARLLKARIAIQISPCDDLIFFFLNVKWVIIVARLHVAQPTYGTHSITCTW
jgi:hypothetical protein